MSKDYYKECVEKVASSNVNKAVKFVGDKAKQHKKLLAGIGAGGAALGGTYALSGDEGKAKIKKGLKVAKNSFVTAQLNGGAQDMLKNIGGAAGTAIAMKRGKSLGKAIGTGGLAGMATGDILGAATVPTYQLYKKHKKEFGTAPDAKSVATVMGANVGPTAALWGGLYGLKKGKKTKQKISQGLSENVGKVVKAGKELGAQTKRLNNSDAIMSAGGVGGVLNSVGNSAKKVGKAGLGVAGAFAPVAVAQELAAIPTYAATPENVINLKKSRLEKQKEGK